VPAALLTTQSVAEPGGATPGEGVDALGCVGEVEFAATAGVTAVVIMISQLQRRRSHT
jgi:hypothetical protein